MRIESLHIYPVKGLQGCDVKKAAVESRGLSHDRRWMIVDAQGKFLTQRECPVFAMIKAEITNNGLRLSCGGNVLDVAMPAAPAISVQVWKSGVTAFPAASEVNAWISAIAGRACRLVFQGAETRAVSQTYGLPGDEVSFADGFPILITHTASLDDLNNKMAKPLPMDRFRPNIVINGGDAWDEDAWKILKIGDVIIEAAKPCTRCVVTTLDQSTGKKDSDEPLASLKKFRLLRKPELTGIVFGQNAIPRALGGIEVGMAVEIVARQDAPVFQTL